MLAPPGYPAPRAGRVLPGPPAAASGEASRSGAGREGGAAQAGAAAAALQHGGRQRVSTYSKAVTAAASQWRAISATACTAARAGEGSARRPAAPTPAGWRASTTTRAACSAGGGRRGSLRQFGRGSGSGRRSVSSGSGGDPFGGPRCLPRMARGSGYGSTKPNNKRGLVIADMMKPHGTPLPAGPSARCARLAGGDGGAPRHPFGSSPPRAPRGPRRHLLAVMKVPNSAGVEVTISMPSSPSRRTSPAVPTPCGWRRSSPPSLLRQRAPAHRPHEGEHLEIRQPHFRQRGQSGNSGVRGGDRGDAERPQLALGEEGARSAANIGDMEFTPRRFHVGHRRRARR